MIHPGPYAAPFRKYRMQTIRLLRIRHKAAVVMSGAETDFGVWDVADISDTVMTP